MRLYRINKRRLCTEATCGLGRAMSNYSQTVAVVDLVGGRLEGGETSSRGLPSLCLGPHVRIMGD